MQVPAIQWRYREVDKFSSQSKGNRDSNRSGKRGGATPIPIATKPGGKPGNKHQPQQDALQKDLELLARLREQIEQLPEIDAAKIVQLHDRILRGEYRIDSKSLADKLSDFESDI